MIRYRRGDAVTVHGGWNDTTAENGAAPFVVYFRRCLVVSWGAQQAALCDVETARNAHVRFYVGDGRSVGAKYGGLGALIVTPGHAADPTAVAEVIAAFVERCRALLPRVDRNATTGSAASVDYWTRKAGAMRGVIARLEAGEPGAYRVADYQDLSAEINTGRRQS